MTDPMTPERLAEIEQRFDSGRVTQRALLAEVRRLQSTAAAALQVTCSGIHMLPGRPW